MLIFTNQYDDINCCCWWYYVFKPPIVWTVTMVCNVKGTIPTRIVPAALGIIMYHGVLDGLNLICTDLVCLACCVEEFRKLCKFLLDSHIQHSSTWSLVQWKEGRTHWWLGKGFGAPFWMVCVVAIDLFVRWEEFCIFRVHWGCQWISVHLCRW